MGILHLSPMTQIFCQFYTLSSGSVYSVIAVAFERFYNICKPFSRNLVSQVYQTSNQQDAVFKGSDCMTLILTRPGVQQCQAQGLVFCP